MSAAAAAAPADAAPKKKGKKTLLIIIVAVLVLVLGGGGAAFFMMKKKAAAEAAAAEDGGEAPAAQEAHDTHHDKGSPPVFLPLDPFTVNLADRESERYAQVAVTLEMQDQKAADEMKAYMPAVRNNILLVLADKTAAELSAREGKEKLAREIRREALRPLGYEVEDDDEEADDGHDAAPKKAKKKKKRAPSYPVKAVQFSNFIIQ